MDFMKVEERASSAEERAREAEERAHVAEERVFEAEKRAFESDRRAWEAEMRAQEAEMRTEEVLEYALSKENEALECRVVYGLAQESEERARCAEARADHAEKLRIQSNMLKFHEVPLSRPSDPNTMRSVVGAPSTD